MKCPRCKSRFEAHEGKPNRCPVCTVELPPAISGVNAIKKRRLLIAASIVTGLCIIGICLPPLFPKKTKAFNFAWDSTGGFVVWRVDDIATLHQADEGDNFVGPISQRVTDRFGRVYVRKDSKIRLLKNRVGERFLSLDYAVPGSVFSHPGEDRLPVAEEGTVFNPSAGMPKKIEARLRGIRYIWQEPD